ncbi:MAG: hypothetical protein IJ600_00855 [Lachnospiraceae bacterium]|nr:hypothetical protein [Lachnospiraceae bacterium]
MPEEVQQDENKRREYEEALEYAARVITKTKPTVTSELRGREKNCNHIVAATDAYVDSTLDTYEKGRYHGIIKRDSGGIGIKYVAKGREPDLRKVTEEGYKISERTREGLRKMLAKMEEMKLEDYGFDPYMEENTKDYSLKKLHAQQKELEEALKEDPPSPDRIIAAQKAHARTRDDMYELFEIAREYFNQSGYIFPGNLDSIRHDDLPFEFTGELHTMAQVNGVYQAYQNWKQNGVDLEAYLENPTKAMMDNYYHRVEEHSFAKAAKQAKTVEDAIDLMTGTGKFAKDLEGFRQSIPASTAVERPLRLPGLLEADPAFQKYNNAIAINLTTEDGVSSQLVNSEYTKYTFFVNGAQNADKEQYNAWMKTLRNLMLVKDDERNLNAMMDGVPETDAKGIIISNGFNSAKYLKEQKEVDYAGIMERAGRVYTKIRQKADEMNGRNKSLAVTPDDVLVATQQLYLEVLTAHPQDKDKPGYRQMQEELKTLPNLLSEDAPEGMKDGMQKAIDGTGNALKEAGKRYRAEQKQAQKQAQNRQELNRKLTIGQFKETFPTLSLSDAGYQYLYDHMTLEEMEKAIRFRQTKDEEFNIFHKWDQPLGRGTINVTKLPAGVRLSGDPEGLKKYLDENVDKLNGSDKAFVLHSIEVAEKSVRLHNEGKTNLENGQPRPGKPEVIVDADGFLQLDIRQPRSQSSANGCWSVALQQLVQSRGVTDVTQEDIRTYRPNRKIEDMQADYRDEIGVRESDDLYNADQASGCMEMIDTVLAFAPNTMVRSIEIMPYDTENSPNLVEGGVTAEQYRENAKELIRQTVEKALFIDRSPLTIRQPGHYVNIVGIKDDILLIQDPAGLVNPPTRMRKVPIDVFVQKMLFEKGDEFHMRNIEMLWASDIQLDKDGKIIGLPDSGVEMAENGEVKLNDRQTYYNGERLLTQQNGRFVNRYANNEDLDIHAPEALSPDGLRRTDRVYLPHTLNAQALKKEADERSQEETDRLKKEAEAYFLNVKDLKGKSLRSIKARGLDAIRQEVLETQQIEEQLKNRPEALNEQQQDLRSAAENKYDAALKYAAELQTIRNNARELLAELRRTGINAQEDPASYTQLVIDLMAVADLSVKNTPEQIKTAVAGVADAASLCSQEFSQMQPQSAEYKKYKAGERKETLQKVHNKFEEMRSAENRPGLMKTEQADPENQNIPLEELLAFPALQRSALRTKEEETEVSVGAEYFAEATERMAAAAREHLKVLDGLKKTNGMDSDQYVQMKRSLQRVAALGRDNTPAEVIDAVSGLKITATAYKEKIDTKGGGNIGNGAKRYNETQKILDDFTAIAQYSYEGKNTAAAEAEGFVSYITGDLTSYADLPKGINLIGKLREQAQLGLEYVLEQGGFVIDDGKDVKEEQRKALEAAIAEFEDVSELAAQMAAEQAAVQADQPAAGQQKAQNAPVQRMTKQQFAEAAEDMGWVSSIGKLSDREILEKIYDQAKKEPDPKLDQLMEDILRENIWETGDRNEFVGRVDDFFKDYRDKANQPVFKELRAPSMVVELEPEELEACTKLIQEQRRKAGRKDGSPKPFERRLELEPEPANPYYTAGVDEAGKKYAYLDEGIGYYKQYTDTVTMIAPLTGLGYDVSLPRVTAKVRTDTKRVTEKEWHEGHRENGDLVAEYNPNYLVSSYISSEEGITAAKYYLRHAKEMFMQEAAKQPDNEDGRLIREMWEDQAFFADPYAGNFAEAYASSPYLYSFYITGSSVPKFGTNVANLSKEDVIAGMRGKHPSQQGLPEAYRQDIFETYMAVTHAGADEVRTALERQKMAQNGWDEEKEKAYAAKLKETHQQMIRSYDALYAVNNIGQYDDFLNNTLDHTVGKDADSRRDIYTEIGGLRGEVQALEMGWRTDELAPMYMVGTMEATIAKFRDTQKRDNNPDPAKMDALDVLEREFAELKKDVWDRKVSTPQEKMELLRKIEDFTELMKEAPFDAFSEKMNMVLPGLQETGKRLGALIPPMTPIANMERRTALDARKAGMQQEYAQQRAAYADADAKDQSYISDVKSRAARQGWYARFSELPQALAETRAVLQRQIRADEERSKRLGIPVDEQEKKARGEVIAILDESIEQLTRTPVYSGEECLNTAKAISERLMPYRALVPVTDTLVKKGIDGLSNRTNGEIEKIYMATRQKAQEPVPTESAQEIYATISELANLLPDDVPEKAQLKQMGEEGFASIITLNGNVANLIPQKGFTPEVSAKVVEQLGKTRAVLEKVRQNADPEKQPMLYTKADYVLTRITALETGRAEDFFTDSFVTSASRSMRGIMDMKLVSEEQLKGKSIEEQKKILEEYEKGAAKDRTSFALMQEAQETFRIASSYVEEKRRAQVAGLNFDDTEYRQKLKESLQKQKTLSEEILKTVDAPDFHIADHPVLNGNEAIGNMHLQRGLASVPKVVATQIALLDAGIALERSAILYNHVETIRSVKEQIEMLKKVQDPQDKNKKIDRPLPQRFVPLVEQAEEILKLSDPELIKNQAEAGIDIEGNLFDKVIALKERCDQLKAQQGLAEDEKEALKGITRSIDKVAADKEDYIYRSLKDAEKDPEKLAALLGRLGTGDGYAVRGADRYLDELTKGDLPVAGPKGIEWHFSEAKTELLRSVLWQMGNREMAGVRLATEEGMAQMKQAADINHRIEGKLSANGVEINGSRPEDFVNEVQYGVYDLHKGELIRTDEGVAQKPTAAEKSAEADRILRERLAQIPKEQQGNFNVFARSEDQIRQEGQVQTREMQSLAEYRARFMQIRANAEEMLQHLDEKTYGNDTDEKDRYKQMRDALVTVTKLDDTKTPAQIAEAMHNLEEKASFFHQKEDGFFSRFKDEVAKHRIQMSAELMELGRDGADKLKLAAAPNEAGNAAPDGIRYVDPDKSLNDQMMSARTKFNADSREKNRRSINIMKLQSEEEMAHPKPEAQRRTVHEQRPAVVQQEQAIQQEHLPGGRGGKK